MSERRQHPRLPVQFYVNEYADGAPELREALDISEGGILLEGSLSIDSDPSSLRMLELQLPETGEILRAWGYPVRICSERQAIRFIAVEPGHSERLAGYLNRLTPGKA